MIAYLPGSSVFYITDSLFSVLLSFIIIIIMMMIIVFMMMIVYLEIGQYNLLFVINDQSQWNKIMVIVN